MLALDFIFASATEM